jgi:TRAP-type C4-dicarboxylate transport system substrate-binding protein
MAHVNLSYITILLLTSTKFYNSLSAEDQKIFDAAGLKAQQVGRDYAVKAEAKYFEIIKGSLSITSPDKKPFRDAVQPIYDAFAKKVDPEFAKLL